MTMQQAVAKHRPCFDPAIVRMEGKPLRGVQISCGECEATEAVSIGSSKGRPDDGREHRRAVRKFTERGWTVATTAERHRCPACTAVEVREEAERAAARQREQEKEMSKHKVVEGKLVLAEAVASPRAMSRDDRRLIFDKLNQVYANEQAGYHAPWTDEKVAVDLGCAIEWVATVREEMFGPAVGAQSNELVAEVRQAIVDMRDTARAISDRADALEVRLVELQRAWA